MFGSHLSISGGMHHAANAAQALGMETVQVFTKNQQQWAAPPLTPVGIDAWKSAVTAAGLGPTVAHDSYLINLASPDDASWAKSIAAFAHEIARCGQLGIPLLVTHPGAHMGSGEETGCQRVAEGLDKAFAEAGSDAKGVTVCLECTAGQGSSLGWRLEHLRDIRKAAACKKRLAVCLDTAHLLAAGYDFRGKKYKAFRTELEEVIGLDLVRCLHLNDSKKDLGTRVDRHEHIGMGFVGLAGFEGFVNEKAFREIPKILETPKGDNEKGVPWDTVNLKALKGLM
jgi:deoxyribonuclease IV